MYQISCKRALTTFFLLGILSLTISGIWAFTLYHKVYDVNVDVVTSYQTIRAANQALLSLNEAALAIDTFLITNNPDLIKQLPKDIILARLNMATLHQLISDDAVELQIFSKLKPLVDKKITSLQQIFSLCTSGNKAAALTTLALDKDRLILTNNINELIMGIKKIEIGQLDEGMPTYQLKKEDADRYFILLGIVNIAWLLLTYLLIKLYWK